MAGKNEALFKPFLFADQELRALVDGLAVKGGALGEALAHLRAGNPGEAEVVLASAMLTAPTEVGGWHKLVLAAAQSARGNEAAAIRTLRNLADASKESRIRLWTWLALRRRGVEPDAALARRVDGVVVEVEGGRGVETLAAYADGTARYLLPTGQRLVWEAPDGRLAQPIAAVVAGAGAVLDALAPGRLPGEPGAATARMTALTPGGPRAAEEPLADAAAATSPRAAFFTAATALLAKLIEIAGW
jgi:hypothetical protein